jgi:hypothetical protein
MDLSKDQIIQIIEFIIDEDGVTPDMFSKHLNQSNVWAIEGFSKSIKTSIRVFDLSSDNIDFIFHCYSENYDTILKQNLNLDNLIIPEKKNYDFTTRCMYSKSGFEYYAYKKNIYSLKSIYWEYDQGDFYPNEGKLVDEDESGSYEMHEWEIWDSSIDNNVKESKEERLKKLIAIKEIVDKKIKELL